MPTGNPLDQLRRRKQSQATPAAFAALAEEHRRAGRLAEAIAVCRDGLERYPTYVSARVTLGRALLDSGDPLTAVAELEQAVAQAPDNLAAARALDAARTACADQPELAPPPPLDDLTLHRAVMPEADPLALVGDFPSESEQAALPPLPDVAFGSLTSGADAPQEFGLRDDWTLPELPADGAPSLSSWDDPAPPIDALPDGPGTLAIAGQADAPTTYLTPPSLQGEEPAGIWPVALTSDAEGDAVEAEPPFAWASAAPGETGEFAAASLVEVPDQGAHGVWDDPTIIVSRPVVETSAPPAPDDDGAAPWTGLFEEPVGEGSEPAAFAGWDAPGPSTPEKPAWGSDDDAAMPSLAAASVSEPVLAPGGSTFAWGEPVAGEWLDTPSTAPQDEQDEIESLPSIADPVLEEPNRQPGATWAGSVASALDEVFRQAGQPHGTPVATEPPPPADDPQRATMADTAVEAAIEDALATTARRDDASAPALASLQQMLDAVRARRAALFTEFKH